MKNIILFFVKLFGWKNLLIWTWTAVHPVLVKLAEKTTQTELDDNFVAMLDKMIKHLTTVELPILEESEVFDITSKALGAFDKK